MKDIVETQPRRVNHQPWIKALYEMLHDSDVVVMASHRDDVVICVINATNGKEAKVVADNIPKAVMQAYKEIKTV